MTPEARREASNTHLASLGVPVAPSLPLIEDESDVSVRTDDELLQRLVALWAVAGAANLPGVPFFREYIQTHGLSNWLSPSESTFLFSADPSENERIHFTWQIEPMYFLAWSAGLVPSISLPVVSSSVDELIPLFPVPSAPDHERLRAAIAVRPKTELVDWADLLYRAHWAVRDAQIRGRETPSGLIGGAVMEWHKAVNWITCYEGEENWDDVSTDT